MFKKLIDLYKGYHHYKRYPKYVVMKGAHVHDRALFFLGKNATVSRDEDVRNIAFSIETQDWVGKNWERRFDYFRSGVYQIIWTKKQLIQVARKMRGEYRQGMNEDFTPLKKNI